MLGAPVPHECAEAHRRNDGQRGIEVHYGREPDSGPAMEMKQAAALIDPVESHAPITSPPAWR